MENIKRCKFAAIFLFCLFFTGCSDNLPDTYQEGSDYQYMEKGIFFPYHQQGEGVQYFVHGHYIYYLDEENGSILPLCGKADCLHENETDDGRISECNAYVQAGADDTGIAFCNGYLYFVDKTDFSLPVLYRLSADGSKKDQIYKWEDNVSIEQWIVHRDVLYYSEHSYTADGDGTGEQYALKALPLNRKNIKGAETIYTAQKNLDVFTLAHPQAYGNFLYFQIHAQTKSEVEITDDNYLDYLYMKTFIYDIKKGQISELALSEMPKGNIIQGVTFWQNRILFMAFDLNKDYTKPNIWYIADLDGFNQEVFMEDVAQGLSFLSDGKYLYLSNASMVSGEDKEQTLKIYDKEITVIDTVTLPYKQNVGEPAIGTPEHMYIFYTEGKTEADTEEQTEWGVACWDKSKIGSYDGSAFEMKKIKYKD